ncbi:xylulokinase [Palleronia caenipelagi]|uniref:Carbohydrate kinase n=1 Tax=Palleronia caenipelagi TaxID=2489174 RepID=A0A547PUP8_9RHOB|nr:FGGY family carbohydrate kinase [Palleronia caenipelagi]TRD17853.1 carbohydrate kinase [Palleronia caenipelagi]
MGDLVLAVDCSTTAAKAVVWNLEGRAVSMGRSGFTHSAPHPGWGEQDPVDWWTATVEAIGKACRQIDVARLAALSITHQRETFVCLDEAGHALRPAMLWLDTRATAEVEDFGSDAVHRTTGKPPNTATSWYKLLWLRAHEPRILDSTARVADVHSYLVNRLTGEWATSWGSVDPLGVLDLERFALDDGLIAESGLSAVHFPTVHAPGTVLGKLHRDVADLLGITPGLPVVAGLGDGQAAGLGVGITRPGEAYLNLGTGIVSGTFSAEYRTDRTFRTMTGGVPGTYLLETFFGGGTYNVTWFNERFSGIGPKPFGLDLSPEQILEAAAADLPAGSEGLLALPYLTGVLTPYWDSNARGVLFGLSPRHGKAHIYRAILEGLALEQRLSTFGAEDVLGARTAHFRLMGGGTHSPLWCQIVSDVLERPVEIAREAEATCLGAGMLAAAGVGLFDSIEDAAATMSGGGRGYAPDPAQSARYAALFEVYRDLYPSLRDQFARLKDVMNELR